MITIRPRTIECLNDWASKRYGVIFVEKKEDIDILFDKLVEQDGYWKNYKKLIKVAPKEIDSPRDLEIFCHYLGKTDIYDIDKLREDSGVKFIIFQC